MHARRLMTCLAGVFIALIVLATSCALWPQYGMASVQSLIEEVLSSEKDQSSFPSPQDVPRAVEFTPTPVARPSLVEVQEQADGSFQYLINGKPELFIGMGYNSIYRNLPDSQRAANYDRDFRVLCQAGVNHIVGWDSDKGYEQDKFDKLTLDRAHKHGLGVLMPFYLPIAGDYENELFLQGLRETAAAKIVRFRDHPALRMWGVGNEVLLEMRAPQMKEPFLRFYLELVDLFHTLDPAHPVIYREAEDVFVGLIREALAKNPPERSWLHYGTNVYTPRLDSILLNWPSIAPHRPLFVTEFGADPAWFGGRGAGYAAMWRTIRAHPSYVLGGAPYTWTTAGPEPRDQRWGLLDAQSQPVDDTFELLTAEWRKERRGLRSCR